MDELERNALDAVQPDLLRLIQCTPELLSRFKHLLTESDISYLECKKYEGPATQVSELLKLLRMRVDGYDALCNALEKTKQTGALQILIKELPPSKNTTGELRCETTSASSISTALIVGNKGCTFKNVIDAVEDSPGYESILSQKWRRVAGKLEIKDGEIIKFSRDIQSGMKDPIDVMLDMLQLWRSANSDNATLDALCNAFEKADCKDIADSVRKLSR